MKETPTYIYFERWSYLEKGKTQVWAVISHRGGQLGMIRWYGPWRQYCFFPAFSTIWNVGCLQEVQNKIGQLMKERKHRIEAEVDMSCLPSAEYPDYGS